MRKIRTGVTMLLLTAILCAGAWYGWKGLSESGFGDIGASPEEECTTPEPVTVRPGQVVVSVYNAGAPSGTGGVLMDALEARGFRPGAVENAPDDVQARGIEVWSNDLESPETQLVVRQLRNAEMVERTNTPGPGINIFISHPFKDLRQGPEEWTVQPEPDC